METNQVTEHLQVIRTLMERSALYRRALAPIMLFAGVAGLSSATTGLAFHLDSTRAFAGLWLGTAAAVVAGAFYIARRQAFKDSEPFWSPPTRRVAQAMFPPLAIGFFLGTLLMIQTRGGSVFIHVLPIMWAIFYGCALHAAGFFVPRGVRLFGWIYIVFSLAWVLYRSLSTADLVFNPHWLMGFFFGVLHLAYGVYLYLTEQGSNVP